MKAFVKLCSVVLEYVLNHASVVRILNILKFFLNFNNVSLVTELLRKAAEHCLRDMVQHLFTRLPQFVDDTRVLNMKVS